MNIRIGRIGRLFARCYSSCLRCLTPWKFVQPHETVVAAAYEPLGVRQFDLFVLCQKCWKELHPVERVRYYHTAWLTRICTSSMNERLAWEDVEQAVLSEDQ